VVRYNKKLGNTFSYWNQLNLSIFGRTLLINSRMLSKIWFKASTVCPSPKEVKQMETQINTYFRKGKKNNTVSAETRVLPPKYGGLGQVHLPTQLHLLRAKWVMKFSAGEQPIWALYWAHNVRMLMIHLRTDTDLRVLSTNWKNLHATDSNKLFPYVVEAYKSWHNLDLKVKLECFEKLACQPLLDNKYITDPTHHMPLKASDDAAELASHLVTLNVGLFFEEVEPCPNIAYEGANPNSWRYMPRSPERMNEILELDGDEDSWHELFALIPISALKVMTYGPSMSIGGWGAIQILSGDPNEALPDFGDIYYIRAQTKEKNMQLIHFKQKGDILVIDSLSDSSWGDWQNDILPNLRPLQVTCISGYPRLLGWADFALGPDTFTLKGGGPKGPSIEALIANRTHHLLKERLPINTCRIKPDFSSLNKKIRHTSKKPMPYLSRWNPSIEELRVHATKSNSTSSAPCQINWQNRFQHIINCPFVGAKYRQFIYWITTGTICTGKQLKHYSPKGLCPHCGVTATWEHMFF
jgi:hypothetical protein